jgi:PKD repeat protein
MCDGPTTVQFTDQSTGEITEWKWDFNGDGVYDLTYNQPTNPTNYYDQNGSYGVTLTVTGPGGSNTLTKPNYIYVSGCG